MRSSSVLLQLGFVFAGLSLVAVGGANVVVADMHRQFVEVRPWLTDREFSELFAIAQAAPGPNAMIVGLIGWHVAGWAGAVVATLAMCVPSGLLTLTVGRAWTRFHDAAWLRAVQEGLAPITVGLILAAGLTVLRATSPSWPLVLLAGVTVAVAVKTRLHPFVMLALGAALGLACAR